MGDAPGRGAVLRPRLRVWRDVKGGRETDKELRALLVDCDLAKKIDSNADVLSGGHKRKLQLAIGLVGGSTSAFRSLTFSCPRLTGSSSGSG